MNKEKIATAKLCATQFVCTIPTITEGGLSIIAKHLGINIYDEVNRNAVHGMFSAKSNYTIHFSDFKEEFKDYPEMIETLEVIFSSNPMMESIMILKD